MDLDAFRCMRRGLQLFTLAPHDLQLLAAISQRNPDKNQRALLLLHGFSSSPAVYRYLIPQLSGYDAIVCPLLPGHGENIEAFSRSKAQDWIALAEQNCETLLGEFTEVDVLGLSLGGLLACHLGNRFQLHHLYLLAPALDLRLNINSALTLAKFLQQLGFSRIRNAAGNIVSHHHCEIAYRQLPLSTIIEMLTLAQQFHFTLPSCPTDLFLGCHDKVIDSWQVGARFAEQTNVTIHWLADSAHVLPLDNDVETIANCINCNQSKTQHIGQGVF